jgi:hypothetical protein
MISKFESYLFRKQSQWGEEFDPTDLNLQFVPYFESGKRIEVDFGYEIKRGTVGVTTGWKPTFILLLTKRSIGSAYTLGKDAKFIKEIK